MGRLKLFIPLIVFLLLAALLIVALATGFKPEPPFALKDKPLPEFSLGDLYSPDKQYTRADVVGEPALINIWATWCAPCRAEHPALLDLHQRGIRIIGVNAKDDLEAARRWLKEYENPYSLVVFDEFGSLVLDLGVTGFPETILVDGEGIIRVRHQGVVNEQVWQEKFAPLWQEYSAASSEPVAGLTASP